MGNADSSSTRRRTLRKFSTKKSQTSMKNTIPPKPVQLVKRQSSAGFKRDRKDRILSCGVDSAHFSESEVVDMVSTLLKNRLRMNDLDMALLNVGERSLKESSEAGKLLLAFSGSASPKISLKKYIERIVHYISGLAAWERDNGRDAAIKSDMAVRYVVIALVFLDRIEKRHSEVLITSQNIHRMLITGVLLAAKTSDDMQPRQKYFSDLGGIPLDEINDLEAKFLKLLNFEAFVLPETFEAYYEQILEIGASIKADEQADNALPRKSSRINLSRSASSGEVTRVGA